MATEHHVMQFAELYTFDTIDMLWMSQGGYLKTRRGRYPLLMKNPVLYYGVIVLGVIALVIGILYLAGSFGVHPARGIAGVVVGAVLLVAGVVGMFMARSSNAVAK